MIHDKLKERANSCHQFIEEASLQPRINAICQVCSAAKMRVAMSLAQLARQDPIHTYY